MRMILPELTNHGYQQSYAGTPPYGSDGYTVTTSRPGNNVTPVTLNIISMVYSCAIGLFCRFLSMTFGSCLGSILHGFY